LVLSPELPSSIVHLCSFDVTFLSRLRGASLPFGFSLSIYSPFLTIFIFFLLLSPHLQMDTHSTKQTEGILHLELIVEHHTF
jgi:hypothetical protein